MGSIYQCKVEGYFTIYSKETAIVDSVSRDHSYLHNNDDVLGFIADHKNLNSFPQGLEKIFKNLQLFRIRYTSIHKVSQSDFKPFPNLKELDMHENEITVLEDGLFDYNPKLVFVSFSKNKLFRIESKVFDNLSTLMYLYLTENECIDTYANNDRDLVEMVVAKTKETCDKKEEPSTVRNDAEVQVLNTTTEAASCEEDASYDEDFPRHGSYRTSGNSSSLQIMFIIIFILAIAVAGAVFYFFSAFRYRY